MSVLKFSSSSKNDYCYNHTYKLNLFSCCFQKKLSWQMKIQQWLTANCQGNTGMKSNRTSCMPNARNTSRLCYFSVAPFVISQIWSLSHRRLYHIQPRDWTLSRGEGSNPKFFQLCEIHGWRSHITITS